MKIFTKFGDLILRMFSFVGMLILEIPNIPNRLRSIDIDKIDTGSFKEKISKIKNDNRINDGISKISDISRLKGKLENSSRVESVDTSKIIESSTEFTSEEKEKTVFMLQIMSGSFLVISMLFIFNFLSLILYVIFGVALIAYILHTLYHKIKLMYTVDFNAYRDFFLMYVAVGIVLVFAGTNPNFVMAFSFGFLPFPNLSILIFAIIAAAAVFLIFRIKYHRNFTYGTVIETGKKTAYVKVDYDICSNIKPDVYIVDNSYGASDGDRVKLQIEEKLLSMNGNKPCSIIEIID